MVWVSLINKYLFSNNNDLSINSYWHFYCILLNTNATKPHIFNVFHIPVANATGNLITTLISKVQHFHCICNLRMAGKPCNNDQVHLLSGIPISYLWVEKILLITV